MTDEAKEPVCETCKGEKEVFIRVYRSHPLYTPPYVAAKIPCPTCGGSGKKKGNVNHSRANTRHESV